MTRPDPQPGVDIADIAHRGGWTAGSLRPMLPYLGGADAQAEPQRVVRADTGETIATVSDHDQPEPAPERPALSLATEHAAELIDYDLLERQYADYSPERLAPVRAWFSAQYQMQFEAGEDDRFAQIMLVLGVLLAEADAAHDDTQRAIFEEKIGRLVGVYTDAVELGLVI